MTKPLQQDCLDYSLHISLCSRMLSPLFFITFYAYLITSHHFPLTPPTAGLVAFCILLILTGAMATYQVVIRDNRKEYSSPTALENQKVGTWPAALA